MRGSMKLPTGDVGLVSVQFALLLGIVAFVDTPLIRVGLAFVVGLLLVQRAVGVPAATSPSASDRRHDPLARDAVSRLLERVREFYTTCHLARSAQITPSEAMERTNKIERNLNQLLAEVVRASRGEALPPGGVGERGSGT